MKRCRAIDSLTGQSAKLVELAVPASIAVSRFERLELTIRKEVATVTGISLVLLVLVGSWTEFRSMHNESWLNGSKSA
jgi:hypothetical protein